MRRVAAALVAVLALAGACAPERAAAPGTPSFSTGNPLNLGSKEPYTLAVIGDMPYGPQKLDSLPLLIDLINRDPRVALVAHLGDIKAGSSGFINDRHWVRGRFAWQEGFGAFSYSHSQLTSVIRYIQNQEKHHARRSFHAEYLELLKKFNVSYDERYLFRPVEDV